MANVRRRGIWRATLVALAMVVLSSCMPARFVNGWVPYWTAPQGRVGFTNPATAGMFNDISPFFFSALPDGTIGLVGSQAQLITTIHEARVRGLTVLPSITDGSGKLVMTDAILADPATRAQHIANIVALTTQYPEIDGVDLDYEGFAFSDGRDSWLRTQPRWRAFVTELAAALHLKGKLLSVTIPPTWLVGGTETGYPVYDQASIGVVADRIKLMVYDFNVSNVGPITPMSWVNQVIAYSNAALPNNKHKLQLGIPSYGRNWGRQVNSDEICPDGALATRSIELENMQGVLDAHGNPPLVRHNSGEVTFTYDVVETGYSTTPIPAPPYTPPAAGASRVVDPAASAVLQPALRLTPPTVQLSCTVRHFVYYPDAITIGMHAQAAVDAGWGGVVLWALGYETPEVYQALAQTTP